jgi:hypothetical protein
VHDAHFSTQMSVPRFAALARIPSTRDVQA